MEYQDLSSVGSSEALLNYQITEQKTDVKPLHVHLKDQHQVVFDDVVNSRFGPDPSCLQHPYYLCLNRQSYPELRNDEHQETEAYDYENRGT